MSVDPSTDIPTPWKYENSKGNWLIWPNTVLDILSVVDCNDTIDGICLKNKSLKQCLDECMRECGAGYHIQFPSGKTICVPVRTSIHPDLNPVYRLRRQSMYPELNHVKISTFVNTNKFPFPPNQANAVFYRDVLTLQEVKTNMAVDTKASRIKSTGSVRLSIGSGDALEILPTKVSTPHIIQYEPIRFGDTIQLSVPGTSLMAKESADHEGMIVWDAITGLYYDRVLAFRLLPVDKNKKIGDIVAYGDSFAIQYANKSIVNVSQYDYLELVYRNLVDILNDPNYNVVFRFSSKMRGYYCDGNMCKTIAIRDIQTQGVLGTYNGKTVSRNPSCWGLCDQPKFRSTNNPSNIYNSGNKRRAIIVLSILVVTILTLLWLRRR